MEQEARPRRVVVAMKGHPGTGKTTLSHVIAASLRCPLLDKDDVCDSTFAVEAQLESTAKVDLRDVTKLLNNLSYESLWRMVKTQLSLGLSVVVDSPLSQKPKDEVELLEGYNGCTDYDVGKVPKLVLDTTATSGKVAELAKLVMEFLDGSTIY